MSDATTIDVTSHAPGRVIGQMWSCPDWCAHDDFQIPPPSRLPKTGSVPVFRVYHAGELACDAEITVGVSISDLVNDDGSVIRDPFVKIRVGDDDEMGLVGAIELKEAIERAIEIAEEDLNSQLVERRLATEDQLT